MAPNYALRLGPSLFISDLHLDASSPEAVSAFEQFLREDTQTATSVYILGDLFEVWVGDDQIDHDSVAAAVVTNLRALSSSGTKVFFMHGNRDFLISERFAFEAGVTLLPDPTRITVDGADTLLMHGDTLCTDDVDYQAFRRMSRSDAWKATFLSKPYAERFAFAQQAREKSTRDKSTKSAEIMDVSATTVEQVFRESGAGQIIHGHTHRPAMHSVDVDGRRCVRRVLADWHPQVMQTSNHI